MKSKREIFAPLVKAVRSIRTPMYDYASSRGSIVGWIKGGRLYYFTLESYCGFAWQIAIRWEKEYQAPAK